MSALAECNYCHSRIPADAAKCPNCGSTDIVGGAPVGTRPARSAGPVTALFILGAVLLAGGVGIVAVGLFVGVATVSAPAPEALPTARPVPAGPAMGFDAVRARGKLRIAADPDSPPFLTREGDTWVGFEGALMQAMAGTVGVPFEVVPASFEDLAGKVAGGDADIAIGQLSAAVSWPGVSWSTSYLQYSYCLVAAKKGAPALRGVAIGVYDDPIAKSLARKLSETEPFVAEDSRTLLAGITARHTAALYDCPLARYDLEKGNPGLGITDDRVGLATYNVAVPAQDDAMRTDVDQVLMDLGNQGLLGKLAERWIPGSVAMDTPDESVVVKAGEDLGAVAARALGSRDKADDLYAWNADILGSDCNAVYAGMALRVHR